MIFETITSEQTTAVHNLYNLLRRLRVIGLIKTTCTSVRVTEMGRPLRYRLRFVSYDPSMKGQLTPQEKLERIMELREFFENSTRQSE